MNKHNMKKQFFKKALVVGFINLSLTVSAQKAKETDAVLEYRKSNTAMMSGDMEAAKKAILKAKEHIDAAAAHEETKASQKTLFNKGEIYYSFLSIGMMTQDTNFIKQGGADPFATAVEAYKAGNAIKGKFNSDIKTSVFSKKMMLDNFTGAMYKNGNFKEAMEMYIAQEQLSDAIGMIDSSSIFNAGLCAEKANDFETAANKYKKCTEINYRVPESYVLAASSFKRAKKDAESKEMLQAGRKKFPNDKNLLLEMVNIFISEGNSAAAEQSLQEAINADPKNKLLYFNIGTIYIDLKQNEKAEAALNKAIEIDPNYADAQYQLGAHLVGLASQCKEQASQLKLGDPNYDILLTKGDDYYKKSLVPLEAYIAKQPNDKEVLTILFQIHKSLKNSEKAIEYKKRADAIK
jgi:tetratricopeptide (TPR) repeat protein